MPDLPVTVNPNQPLSCCPICCEVHSKYLFLRNGCSLVRCVGCGLVYIAQANDQKAYITPQNSVEDKLDPDILWTDSITEQDAAAGYVGLLKNMGISSLGRILLVAPPDHVIASEIIKAGWLLSQYETEKPLEKFAPDGGFDAAVVLYRLEKAIDPIDVLNNVNRALKPGGMLMVMTPSLDSISAQLFGSQWPEWRGENRFYFNQTTINLLLWRYGFDQIEICKDRRKYTLSHIHDRAKTFPITWITRLIKIAYFIVPSIFKDLRLRLPSSGMIVSARKADAHLPEVCSVIVPVYNESQTFPILMDALLNKEMSGIRKEIIIVESNSKDGTRDQVLKYQNVPEVKIVLQDKPLGKGFAVRAGFEHATGDIVLIQDADLEYDLNDYETLLEPIVAFKQPFVLGSRHGGDTLKMRHFDDLPLLSLALNFGHLFFTALVNLLLGLRLKDPFTMFKVFRRDCLFGLDFTCNRFDFDFELLIKLVRKGYNPPLEIPVNYRSRSFQQGKKVNMWRDPWTWIWAALKSRFGPLYRKEK